MIIALILYVHALKASVETMKEKINQLDPMRTALFIPGFVCLLLALQWGGLAYDWSSVPTVVFFILASLLLLGFIGVQLWKQETPRFHLGLSCSVAWLPGSSIHFVLDLRWWSWSTFGRSSSKPLQILLRMSLAS